MKDDLVERVRRFWEDAFNGRNLDLVGEFVTPGFVNHNALPGTPPGPQGQRELMLRLWEAFPDGRFEIHHVARDGDTVICIGVMSGTHEGTLMGVPATGRRAEWRQCHLFRVDADGRAFDHNAIRDDVGLMRQLGVAPGAS